MEPTLPDHQASSRVSSYVGMAELTSGNSVVWSGLTGFVGILPPYMARKLKIGTITKSDDLYAALNAEGLFCDGPEDDALIDILESLAVYGRRPTHYRLVMTGSCDLTCSYCIQAKLRKSMDNRINTRVIGDLVRYVEFHSQDGPVEILLMGGEPLIDVPLAVATIRGLAFAFTKNGRITPRFKLLTNGLNLSDFVRLIGSDASIISSIQVSVDQDRETHDAAKKDRDGKPTYDRVILGVREAIRARMNTTLRLNIHQPEKVEQILQTCSELYDDLGVKNFLIYPALVIQRPLAKHRRNWSIEKASSSFSRFLIEFFCWFERKTGQIHPRHLPPARWINCLPKLGPASMLGARGEVYSCTYSSAKSPNIDDELNKSQAFPLSREKCTALAQEVWNDTCRKCKFVAFCTGSCSVKTAAGQQFTADCESWPERLRTYGEIIEKRISPEACLSLADPAENC